MLLQNLLILLAHLVKETEHPLVNNVLLLEGFVDNLEGMHLLQLTRMVFFLVPVSALLGYRILLVLCLHLAGFTGG